MAQPQNNVSLTAPGFYGLNTQDSPLDMEINFASEANNCVIDNFGRIASRQGFQYLTTNPEVLDGNPIVSLFEFLPVNGDAPIIFACGNGKIFSTEEGRSDLVELADLGVGDNWQMAQLKNKCYFVQKGQVPLVYDAGVLEPWEQLPKGTDYPSCIHAAYGRIWVGGFASDSGEVFFSGLLDGENWTDQGTGSIDTALYWPSGYDTITALASHNNFMVVFGKRNILLYQTTSDVVSTISLVDAIEGIGCIARDSVVATGIDFMFVDSTGVRSLNRTIQEKSVPIGDISRNVRLDFQYALSVETTDDIKAVFHVEDSFYACFLPSNPLTYVFDTWQMLPNGSGRASTWTNIRPRCGVRLEQRRTLFGGNGGVYEYSGGNDLYLDPSDDVTEVTQEIPMSYVTHPLDFGSPSNLIFPKQVDVTFFGALTGELTLKWGYDYAPAQEPRKITKGLVGSGDFTFWYPEGTPMDTVGAAEWTQEISPAEDNAGFWSTGSSLQQFKYNVWGSGRTVRYGFFANTLGAPISIQEINIQVLQGRIL